MDSNSYKSIKDSIDFDKAVSLREDFKLKNRNWEEYSEEDNLKYGLALITLESLNKLDEVDKDIDSRLYEEDGTWYLKDYQDGQKDK